MVKRSLSIVQQEVDSISNKTVYDTSYTHSVHFPRQFIREIFFFVLVNIVNIF